MELFKDLTKCTWFLMLFLTSSCLFVTLFYARNQDFLLQKLSWTEQQQSNTNQTETDVVPTNTRMSSKNTNAAKTQLDSTSEKHEEIIPTKPICDFSDRRSNFCNMTGDIRTRANSTVFFVLPSNETFSKEHEWTFSPYSDKVFGSKQVTVKQLRANQDGPICTIRSDIPAVIFALRGQNLWHYISDIIIPLFLAAKPYNGEVQLVIIDYHQWFVDKYNLILKDLTRYEIINFDQDKEVRCYPHAMVGLLSHRLLGIDPKRAFDRYDLYKFRLYLRKVFSLPMDLDVPYKADPTVDKKPRLMLVLRSGFRKLLNEPEISEMIEKLGFELIKIEPKKSDNLTELSKLVDSCDVIMGVHGAGLTNMLFLRTNAIMIQIVMYGHIESFAYDYFGRQATDMKLRQLNYSVAAEESSLLEKYGWNHSCIKDPDSVNAKGWQDRMKYYWIEQNIRLNVTSFEPVLVKALQMIKE